MRHQLVYDLPVRLFHWLFAGLFVTAFFIVKTIDDESIIFSYHMLAGLMLVFIVSLRLIWGGIGPKYARFSSFALHPRDLVDYFLNLLSGNKRKWAGHNPASSWATLGMFTCALGLGATGYLMATGQRENFEDIHELLANGFLVLVLLHIAGVLLHAFRHQDGIAMSMIDGKKSDVPNSQPLPGSKPLVAVLFLVLVATFAIYLAKNFDTATRRLNLFGTYLQLGEEEESEGASFENIETSEEDED